MTQVSRRPLKKDIEARISEVFSEAISNVRGADDVYSFIHDLLSPVEQLMLAKRLAIALMLYKGYNQRSVCQTLKVSLGTVSRVNAVLQYKGVGYRKVILHVIGKDTQKEFWKIIEDFVLEFVKPKREAWRNDFKRQKQEAF
jgi:uncharacterized protein YerC